MKATITAVICLVLFTLCACAGQTRITATPSPTSIPAPTPTTPPTPTGASLPGPVLTTVPSGANPDATGDIDLALQVQSPQVIAGAENTYTLTLRNLGPTLRTDLLNVQARLSTRRAEISTGLLQILGDYVERLSQVRATLFLLTTQALIFVLYTLTMLTSFMLERSQAELATLAGRGASAWQITRVFGLEYLALAAPAALLLGPGLAQGALRLWAGASLPSESWLLSGIAASLSWLALVLPIFPAARGNILAWQQARARPARTSAAQEHYLDLFLLLFGGLLYWQLRESGSFVTQLRGGEQLTDPLLLLGPSLLLVAVAMVFLRLFPWLLRLCAWALQRLRGLMLPLGLQRLARDPLKPSRVVLLISLTTGLILFTHTFGNSLSHSQEQTARYLAGADFASPWRQPTRQSSNWALFPACWPPRRFSVALCRPGGARRCSCWPSIRPRSPRRPATLPLAATRFRPSWRPCSRKLWPTCCPPSFHPRPCRRTGTWETR